MKMIYDRAILSCDSRARASGLPEAGTVSSGNPASTGDCDGHSVEIKLVALDVPHHNARLVVVIGGQ
jgi:hypothetical protein